MVGTPMYNAQADTQFQLSCLGLLKLCQKLGITLDFKFIYNESLVQRGRNQIAHFFMKTDFTHLLFIDADIRFIPQQVIEMLLHTETFHGIIGANYPKKQINWASVKYAVDQGVRVDKLAHCSGLHTTIIKKDTKEFNPIIPLEVDYVPTGFMLIPKNCFNEYAKNFPEMSYRNNHIVDCPQNEPVVAYFHCEINKSGIYLSEDYYFCEKLRDLGIKIYVVPNIHLCHVGSYTFEGCFLCSLGIHIHDIKQ